jgi:hypothetical protein
MRNAAISEFFFFLSWQQRIADSEWHRVALPHQHGARRGIRHLDIYSLANLNSIL